MDAYKKERSSRHHMKINIHSNGGSQESNQDGLFLANPMTCGIVSPGDKQVTSPKQDVHFSRFNSTSPPAVGERDPPHSTAISHSKTDSFECSNNSSQTGSLSRSSGVSSERSSFRDKSKSRSKSPSLFRFFVKQGSHSGPGSTNGSVNSSPMTGASGKRAMKRSIPAEDEEDYGGDASSNSDHEDPFSPRGISTNGDLIANKHATAESPKTDSLSVEQTGVLPQQLKRHVRNSSSGSGTYTCRDSGFSSERESVSQLREDREIFEDARCSLSPCPVEEEFRGAGMEALENLHNQLQILIKQNSPSEDTSSESMAVYEQVIANLSRQLEDLSITVDCLRESDQTLRSSLRMTEQKVLESEAKLGQALERCQRMEGRYLKLYSKHSAAVKRVKELEKMQQKQAQLHSLGINSSPGRTRTKVVQRVHSQNQYDRKPRPDSAPSSGSRPSTAQGFHQDPPVHRKISSMSHTETCV